MELEQRLTRIETALPYELARINSRVDHLEQELHSHPFHQLGEALTGMTLLKLLLAICLPLLVLLVTGDPKQAASVAKLLPGS